MQAILWFSVACFLKKNELKAKQSATIPAMYPKKEETKWTILNQIKGIFRYFVAWIHCPAKIPTRHASITRIRATRPENKREKYKIDINNQYKTKF